MSQYTKKGCGDRMNMGHGDNAVCGQPYVMGIFYCERCRRQILKENLEELSAQRDDLLAAMQRYLPFIPPSSAKEGGAASHSENVKAADQFREAIAKAVQP